MKYFLVILLSATILTSGCASYLKGFDTSVSVANIVNVDLTVGGWKSASSDEDYNDMEESVVTQEDGLEDVADETVETTDTESASLEYDSLFSMR